MQTTNNGSFQFSINNLLATDSNTDNEHDNTKNVFITSNRIIDRLAQSIVFSKRFLVLVPVGARAQNQVC